MQRKALLLFLTVALSASQGSTDELRYESKRLGVRFRYPQNFLVAQPATLPGSDDMAAAMGARYIPPDEESLVERRLAEGQDLKALPRGILQISLRRCRGPEADFLRQFMMKDVVRQRIGAWEVYVLPGAPGPYGDQAIYDVIPLKDGSILEILAPRFSSYSSDPDNRPTGYDRVIRRLIETLEIIE